jgi:hypothetical protein
MDKNNVTKVLTEREGYTQKRAVLLANECQNISEELLPLFEKWLQDASVKEDFTVQGYSLLNMMQQREMHYLAALLDMDWLIKEPEKTKPVIDSFMK